MNSSDQQISARIGIEKHPANPHSNVCLNAVQTAGGI
jgi:hypothetical protein